MKLVRIACKLSGVLLLALILTTPNVFASLTKEQAADVAMFATTFIEKGNERRDENGYPLLVYALSNNWKICIEIRRSGYFEELYHVKNNNYHMKNGKYLDLGLKWCMDCGDFISYVYKTTLGLDMYLQEEEDPWHIKDMYADANKGENSKYFTFIYKNVPISKIKEENLQLGDVVLKMGPRENHGLIYVGEGMQTAHASRNGIKYRKQPVILGFEVVQLNKFYKSSTVVSIVRVKDGVVDESLIANGTITWPDTLETEDLLGNSVVDAESELLKNISEENEILEIQYVYNTWAAAKQIEEEVLTDKQSSIARKMDYYNYQKQMWGWIIAEIKKFLLQTQC